MSDGPLLGWDHVVRVHALQGSLADFLATLPRTRWTEQDPQGLTLLHYTGFGRNEAAFAVLLVHGLSATSPSRAYSLYVTHIAADNAQHRVLELALAAGANARAACSIGLAPLDFALREPEGERCVRVLLANGVRLSTVSEAFRSLITPELEAFERGVLRCRAAVVAMLRVKRAGRLVRWDKFSLAELAVCVWSTRFDKGWQN